MYINVEEIPDSYRHMFYPPRIHKIDMENSTPDFWLLNKKVREGLILKANMDFFIGEIEGKQEISEDEKLLSRLKYAYINEGPNKYITFVDNEAMKAYRMKDDSYYEGLLCPLEQVDNFTFDRWCRGMDL